MGQELTMLAVIRGGNWNNGSDAGLWAVNLNNTRSNSNDNVGLRA
jgi:RNA-directed DNA polymerase